MPSKIRKKRSNGRPIGGARAGAGRPSSYTVEVADLICVELTKGRSLIQICNDPGMPERHTVVRWLLNHPEFEPKYVRARESQADFMDDRIIDVADGSTDDTAASDRVKIGAYQWRAERLAPKKYGNKVHKELTGANGGPVKVNVNGMTDEQLAAIEAALTDSTDTVGRTVGLGQDGKSEEEG